MIPYYIWYKRVFIAYCINEYLDYLWCINIINNKCMENTNDLVSHFKLQNNTVMVVLESSISTLQLNTLLYKDGNDNQKALNTFYEELGSSPKKLVAISSKVKEDYPELEIGDSVLFNEYGNPKSVINTKDEYDLDNVIANYKLDKQDPKFNTNVIGIKYKVRAYYIYQATAILTVIK